MNDKIKQEIKDNRNSLVPVWARLREIKTDRQLDLPKPNMFKKYEGETITLLKEFPNLKQKTLTECIKNRRSLRSYKNQPLTFEELSYLVYETCRVDFVKKTAVFRSIPTGGATNAMETYLFINDVENIQKGLYHYIQNEHKITLLDNKNTIEQQINDGLNQQLRNAQVAFIFSAVPYRSEYKYSFCAHKMIAIEAGHAAQNLSLAAEVIDSGACALAAYNQEVIDNVLKLDTTTEFVTYAVTVGKK